MSVLVLFESVAAAGSEDELASLFAELLPDTRAFEGCEYVTLHRDQDAPDRFMLVERFTTRASYEAYVEWRVQRGDVDRLSRLLAERPGPRFFDDIDA